ncbi:MAG TPA: hypothetical protein PKM70_03535 [Clostridia bacterium]|nr:hypothetical protein [Clostridia bacterium]
MKRKVLILLLILIIVLSSCVGGGSDPTPEPTTEPTPIPAMNFEVTNIKNIDIAKSGVIPDYIDMNQAQAWDCTGIDPNGIIYFGITVVRRRDEFKGKEDFAVLSYNPDTEELKFHGTFMNAAKEAGTLYDDEQLPKGHTQFIYYNGKMYMGSQNFHDAGKFDTKTTIPDNKPMDKMHGGHLFSLDVETEELKDETAHLPNGVLIEHEGILQVRLIPGTSTLVCMSTPEYKLVFYNLETKTIEKTVDTTGWMPNNPLSREIVIVEDRIYVYRGVEDDVTVRENLYPIYYYDITKDEFVETEYEAFGGFWNGQCTTPDGKTTFVSSCCGELYSIDHETFEIKHHGNLKTPDKKTVINYLYSLCMAPDGRKIFYVPSVYLKDYGVMQYDIETGEITSLSPMPLAIYTGNGVIDDQGRLYFTKFGSASMRSGKFELCEITIQGSPIS